MLRILESLIPSRSGVERRVAKAASALDQGWSLDVFAELEQFAQGGNAEAQFRLGLCFERAEGVVQNLADAAYWYRRAAEGGHLAAQSRLGLIHLIEPPSAAAVTDEVGAERDPALGKSLGSSFANGVAAVQDFAEAAKWNRVAAEKGDSEALARLGHQFAFGLGIPRDRAKAERAFEAAAKKGNVAGQAGLGVLLAGGYGGEPRPGAAAVWLRSAAGAGNVTAQYWLGLLHLRGVGVERDGKIASRLLAKAAGLGHVGAMQALGLAYWRGDVLPRRINTAESWLRRAASRGHVGGMRGLAHLLLESGRPGVDLEAAEWLGKAAESGDASSAALLAELCLLGRGLPNDVAQVEQLLKVAGEAARPEAYNALALLQLDKRDDRAVDSAIRWLELAAIRGSAAAHRNLASLYRFHSSKESGSAATTHFRVAASMGDADAAFQLGALCIGEDAEPESKVEGLRWLRFAAASHHGRALCNLALLAMREGFGSVSALRRLEDAARSGSVDASELLFDLYSNGKHLTPNEGRALGWLLHALMLGSVPAAKLAIILQRRDLVFIADADRLLVILRAAAEAGDVEAQEAVGWLEKEAARIMRP